MKFLKKLYKNPEYELWTGAIQRAEIVFFMKEEERTQTMLFLSMFETDTLDHSIVDLAGDLYRQWHPSHGIDINDAFLAATVMLHGGLIHTLNAKYFPMPEVKALKAW